MRRGRERPASISPPRPWVEWGLVLAGIVLLARSGFEWHRYSGFQHKSLATPNRVALVRKPADNGDPRVIGRLEIPRLRLSAVVVEGDDENSLGVGVGHMPGTAAIGSRVGNVILAGHRDTAFWPLRNARVGDVISVVAGRTYEYQIVKIRVIEADDVSAIQSSYTAKLTLVSCYPFRHVGPAPKRIVFTAAPVWPENENFLDPAALR